MTRFKQIIALTLLSVFLCLPVAGWARDDDRWKDLSPKEKEDVRRNYQRWKNLPPQDKERLREEWNRWQNLPQDRRDKLRQRYDELQRDRRER